MDEFDFEELKNRLNEISATLHQILDEQRGSNIAMENIGDEITFSNERMDKYIYDNNNGLWYELQGDYYIPCLVLPTEKEERHIGIWGHRHLRYIREHAGRDFL